MKQIDTGLTSEVWAVDHDDNIYRLKPEKTWENIQGKLKYVTAGASGRNSEVLVKLSLVREKYKFFHYLRRESQKVDVSSEGTSRREGP